MNKFNVKRSCEKGFSMIELLVVLLIIGILAAVSAPMFLANADKAKASEAVAGVGAIRSAERIYAMQHGGSYLAPIVDGSIYFQGTAGANTTLGVDTRNAKYFSPKSYTVALASGVDAAFTSAGVTPAVPVDFMITANGGLSELSTAANDGKARNADEVQVTGKQMIVKMDNSGVIVYSLNNGTSYTQW